MSGSLLHIHSINPQFHSFDSQSHGPLLFTFGVIVHIFIPKQSLVAVTPRKRLVPDIQVFVLWSLRWRGTVLLMFPVLVPKDVGVGSGDKERWDGNVDRQFTPQL